MNNRRIELSNDNVEELINELQQITTRIDHISDTLHDAGIRTRNAATNTQRRRRAARQVKVGDRVEVTSSYKNRRGITGTVVRLTPTQAYIRPEGDTGEFRVYKQNIKQTEP